MGSEILRVVEVSELKAQLTDCIRAVGKGELVIILEDEIPMHRFSLLSLRRQR